MQIPDNIITLDCETTGLWIQQGHEPWEVTYAVGDREPITLELHHDPSHADPKALEINRYHERVGTLPRATREQVKKMSDDLIGAVILGSNPEFDKRMLDHWVFAGKWHYTSINVKELAMLMLDLPAPIGLVPLVDELNSKYDAHIPLPDHTSRGDVIATREAYRFIRDWRSMLVSWPTNC